MEKVRGEAEEELSSLQQRFKRFFQYRAKKADWTSSFRLPVDSVAQGARAADLRARTGMAHFLIRRGALNLVIRP